MRGFRAISAITAGLAAALGALASPPEPAGAASWASRIEAQFKAAKGTGSGIAVNLKTGEVIWQHDPDTLMIPASVNKLFTTAAFLLDTGPQTTLATRAVVPSAPAAPAADGGVAPSDGLAGLISSSGTLLTNVYIKGGGDPSLGPAGITQLAAAVRRAGIKSIPGKVIGDDSFFDRIRGVPALGGIDPYQGGLLGGLAYDHTGSAKAAASAFTLALRQAGVLVPKGHTITGTAPLAFRELARHDSAPVSTLIKWTNLPSDNFYAEMLTKAHGAIKRKQGSTDSGLKAAEAVLANLGVRPVRVDGSGLSRRNSTSARTVHKLLNAMASNRVFVDSLPTAGVSGTLATRLRGTSAQGRCHAKTGTLSNMSALAGYCFTTKGATVSFALLMNYVKPANARHRQDQIVKALAIQ